MPITPPFHPADWQGLARLAGDGVDGTSQLVEQLHLTILRVAAPLGPEVQGRARGITGLVYGSIRGINGLVGRTIDGVAGPIVRRLPPYGSTYAREQWLAAVNGVLGDHLAATANPLALPMAFRHRGEALSISPSTLADTFPEAAGRLLISVHGLCMNDLHWHGGKDAARGMPERLARAFGYTPLYLHYNTGLPIAENGAAFARQIGELVDSWPVDVQEVALIGHSMGGLVIRHAFDAGRAERLAWVDKARKVAFLGTPHQGAPLERAGHRVDRMLGFSPYSAPFARLGKLRSAGIVDLRHGVTSDIGRMDGVDCLAVAARARGDEKNGSPGDGLVPIDSAVGRHTDPEQAMGFDDDRRHVIADTRHLGLLRSPAVYRHLHRWLRRPPANE